MYLFWDPTSGYTFPSSEGWQVVNTYNGRFIRGDSVANALTTGGDGSRPFSPGVTVTVGAPNEAGNANGNAGSYATTSHTHNPPTYTLGVDNNGDPSNPDVPAFRTLELMEYLPSSGTCLPTTIPAGAIAMFNDTTLPVNFTAYNAENNKMIRLGSSITTGGGDTITNTVSNISGLSADPNGSTDGENKTGSNFFSTSNNTSDAATHTHGPPSPNYFTTTAVSSLPPYVQPIVGQATANIPTLSINIIAMFDGDPGATWTVESNIGGPYNGQFLRAASAYNLTSQGALTHTDPSVTVVSGPATPEDTTKTYNFLGIGGSLATSTHTHNITFAFGSVTNVPPYVNFVIAQKVSFTINSFRWYVDPPGATTPAVTDPWPAGGLDINPDTILPAIPAPFRPPDVLDNTQLRLRVQIMVVGKPLPIDGTAFKIQYQATPNSDCLSGAWTDVGASGSGAAWQYGTNNVPDSTVLPAPLALGSSVAEVFSKSASGGTVPNAVSTGQTAEYDWLIQDTSAASGTEYHFRVIETSGTPFGSYYKNGTTTPECPDVVTKPGVDQQLRGGDFFLTNPAASKNQDPEQGFEWAD